jgi:hypothetical protein
MLTKKFHRLAHFSTVLILRLGRAICFGCYEHCDDLIECRYCHYKFCDYCLMHHVCQ